MVKNKKMSKSAVAIIVLSLLLVLSMVMGLTGAWFSDTGSKQHGSQIQFGSVRVTPSDMSGAWKDYSDVTISSRKIVPGDKYLAGGTVDFSATNVDVYALITFDARIYTAYSAGVYSGEVTSDLATYLHPSIESGITGEQATAITSLSSGSLSANERMYSMTAAQAAALTAAPISGQLLIDLNTPNKVGEHQLNGNENYYIVFDLSVAVVQKDNVVDTAEAHTLLSQAKAYNSTATWEYNAG